MKYLHHFILFLLLAACSHALPTTTSFEYSTEGVTIPAGGYDLTFGVTWFADDFPQASAPGRIELVDGAGNVLGQVSATVHQVSGPAVSASPGSVSGVQAAVAIYTVSGTPADGSLQAVWHITGVPPGNYTLRFYEYRTDAQMTINTTVWTTTYSISGSPAGGTAPTIAWTASPASAGSEQTYTVSAHGHDDDGNLTQVNVWKNGQPFAIAGGGNGTDGDSGNATSDAGPQTVTFTAQAVDATGATSPVITHVVTIGAPANQAPSISWNTTPGTVANGQTYTVSAHGHDNDGNLTQVNVWKNGLPFAFAGGGNGTDGDSMNSSSDAGPQTITYTAQAVDGAGAASAVITQVVSVNAPVNNPPTVTLISPSSQTVTAGTTLTLSARATDPDGNISSHNLDIQRPAGDWNFQGGFATGEPYQGGPVGKGSDSTRTASFTFTDMGTYYVRSGVSDGSGWYHSATVAITVVPPPPVQYTLATSAAAGGSVSAGGTFTAGTSVTVSATPDAIHDFAGWSGDAGGTGNPVGVLMDRNKSVQANFTLKAFTLTTNALSGGAVTPGGNYPIGTTVTIAANPDSTHYFMGWSGDASGTAPAVAVLIDRAKFVQAQFAPKAAQTITFASPGDQNVGATVVLSATSSAGLPVNFAVVSGPAKLSGQALTITGPGAITVQAAQGGDAYTLPALPVAVAFNATVVARLRYQSAARTLLVGGETTSGTNFVLGNP